MANNPETTEHIVAPTGPGGGLLGYATDAECIEACLKRIGFLERANGELRNENDHLRALIGAQDVHHCEYDGCMQTELGADGYRAEAEVWVKKYHAMKRRLVELGESMQ